MFYTCILEYLFETLKQVKLTDGSEKYNGSRLMGQRLRRGMKESSGTLVMFCMLTGELCYKIYEFVKMQLIRIYTICEFQ